MINMQTETPMKMKNSSLRLTQAAMIAALAYIGFQFLRIDIPVGPERTAFHLGNTFVVLGALLQYFAVLLYAI